MLAKLPAYLRRHHLALLALFVSLGGTSYAATTKLLPPNSVGTRQVIDHSLLNGDFKRGQIPQGQQGPQGPQGPAGPTGTVDTSNFYTKVASDGRFLGKTAKAANADKLDGIDSTGFYLAGSKVADADKLDGIDSTGFYAAGSKVADSNLLDGKDSAAFGPPPTLVSYFEYRGAPRMKFLDLNGLQLFATCPNSGSLTLDAETTRLNSSFIAVSYVSDGPGNNTPVYVEKSNFAPTAAFSNFLGTNNHSAGTLVYRTLEQFGRIVTVNFQAFEGNDSAGVGFCIVSGTALAAG